MIEIVPETLPGQTRCPVADRESEITQIENAAMIRFQKRVDRLTLMIFKELPEEKVVEEIALYPDIWCLDKKNGRLLIYENQ